MGGVWLREHRISGDNDPSRPRSREWRSWANWAECRAGGRESGAMAVPTILAQGVERSVSSETTVPKILAQGKARQGSTWLRVSAHRVRDASRRTQSPW